MRAIALALLLAASLIVGLTLPERAPWLVIWPGLAISLAVSGTNLLGDALRDTLDPRLRGS